MPYFISFLEGIVTFISPCLLPMLPIYLLYFLGGDRNAPKGRAVKNAVGFVLGFTLVFAALGAFAGTVGAFLTQHQAIVNLVAGFIVILFGLNFVGVLKIGFLNKNHGKAFQGKTLGFFSSVLFGIVFSISWTPCVGAFLSSALMLASQQGSAIAGIVMLLLYSLGLGLPMILSAVLIDRLKSAFDFIKRHYKAINLISGIFLIVVGVMMMTGTMGYLLSLLSF